MTEQCKPSQDSDSPALEEVKVVLTQALNTFSDGATSEPAGRTPSDNDAHLFDDMVPKWHKLANCTIV